MTLVDADFEERCFEFTLEEDNDLHLPWCISQMSYSKELWIAPNVSQSNWKYREVAKDFEVILHALRDEDAFAGMSIRVRDSNTIAIEPTAAQKFILKLKFCGEELVEE